MPTVKYEHETIRNLLSFHDIVYDPELWEKELSDIGCVVEEADEEGIEIEVFPDRSDLLSVETMTRAARAFLYSNITSPNLKVKTGTISMEIEPEISTIRPVILGAIVRNVNIGSTNEEKDQFIQSLMDHQEKLHLTLGRKRRLASIGVHDLSTLAPPFKVRAVDRNHRFIPLAMNTEMSIQEILDSHPKGMEYAHLLDGMESVPVIEDAVGRTLSFPPIINGNHTTVTETTTDFFIDVTGWDERACEASLLLVCLSLAERGGEIESINLTSANGEEMVTPNGKARTHVLPEPLLEKILGGKIESSVIHSALERMGGKLIETRTATDGPRKSNRWGEASVGEKIHIIEMPRWRFDILHPIDLVEEIATGIGYESLGEAHSSLALEGVPLTRANLTRRINESLSSQGIQQVQSLTLSNEISQFSNMRWRPQGEVTRIANPITIEHTILRQNILPSLLEILAENRHHELPQRIQECGEVVRDHHNAWRVSWACAETNAGFTAAKGIAQALTRDLGAREDISFIPLEDKEGPWIPGRGAKMLIGEIELGTFGEIDPEISEIYGLKVPIHAGEFDLRALAEAIPDPLI
tara:strand:- start:11995 stop:13746 length:1752 start_codon:yes stop_codon:yes gene_type:complete